MATPRISQKMIDRELQRIARNVPEELIKKLLKKESIAPTIDELVKKALAGEAGEITEEQRRRFENMRAAGVLSREIDVIDKDGEAAIDAWYEAEIALAVKLGRLPKEAPMPSFIKKKGIKHARKQQTRLKELFSAEEGAEVSEGSDNPQDAGTSSAQPDDDQVLPPRTGGGD